MDERAGRVVAVVSRDQELIARAGDAVAAAGLTLVVHDSAAPDRWTDARAVLVGGDEVEGLARTGLARRDEVLILGRDGQEASLWRAAGDLPAAGAVALPAAGAWLVQWLKSRDAALTSGRSVVAAVFSAAGGVGCSTLAAALAVTAVRADLRPLLIDAHPGPAGVDLLLGDVAGADHWGRYAAIRGPLPPEELDTLPVLEGVRCLGWGGARELPLWFGALGSVVAAAGHGHELVVIDAGLHAPPVEELPRRTRPILLVPATWRGVLAARPRLAALAGAFDEPPMIVLRDVGGKADPRVWQREFEGRRVLLLGFDGSVIDDEDQGRPPGTRPRSGIGRCSKRLLAALGEQAAAA